MTIKRLTAANENRVTGRSRQQAQRYWAETHGKLVANNPNLRQYHHYFSVPEAYEHEPRPTFMGVSMFWRDDPLAFMTPWPAPEFAPIGPDDRQVFDRSKRWPMDDQIGNCIGEEHVIIDGVSKPGMINALFMVTRLVGLDHRSFFDYWLNTHTGIAARLPGLRRYNVNFVVLDYLAHGTMTHDGWSEMWFDDYAAFQAAYHSPEWRAMEADGRSLFTDKKAVIIGTEYVQKDASWAARDYGALSLSEDQIRARLQREGYETLLHDPQAAAKIKAAAQKGLLAVWTEEHIVTLDESRIDARPAYLEALIAKI
jgi:uncharacterized protein (TIGR02118 family)